MRTGQRLSGLPRIHFLTSYRSGTFSTPSAGLTLQPVSLPRYGEPKAGSALLGALMSTRVDSPHGLRSFNAGAADEYTPRVLHASDDPAVVALQALAGGTATAGGAKDAGPSWTSAHGIAGVPFTSADQHSAAASVTPAPTSGQKLVVTDLFFSTDTAMNVTFKEETSGTVISGPYYVPANFAGQLTPRSKAWKLPVADKKLQVITSVAGNIMVDAHYYSEA